MRPGREVGFVVALCAVLYVTGTDRVAFYTRGEPREGLVVQEMRRTGEWLVPARPAGEPARKPPLYYWVAAGATTLWPRPPEWPLRLPSAIFATVGVVALWWGARVTAGAAAALPAALVLATAFEWVRAATSARVDATLAGAMAVAFAAWLVALARGGRGPLALAALATGAGVLAKGPVALVLPALGAAGLALLARDRAAVRPLRPVLVLTAGAAIGGLWYGAAFLREGSAFLEVVLKENVLRFVDAESSGVGHSHAPGYLVLLGLVGLLPWSLLLPLAAAPLGRARASRTTAFLAAAWAIGGLVFFELATGKRSVYLLPVFPAVAWLIGAGAAAPPTGWAGRAARLGAGLLVVLTLALAAVGVVFALGIDPVAPFAALLDPDEAVGARGVATAAAAARSAFALLALGTAAAAVALWDARRRIDYRRIVLLGASLVAVWTAAFNGLIHPAIARTRTLAPFMARVDALASREAVLYAFLPVDPGLRFYAPRAVLQWPAEGTAGGGALLLVWEDEWQRLRGAGGAPLTPILVSEPAQKSRGHLVLVSPPPGRLVTAPPSKSPGEPQGLRSR